MDAHRSLRARRASEGVTARQTSCGPLSIRQPDGEEPTDGEEPADGGRNVGLVLTIVAILALLLGGGA